MLAYLTYTRSLTKVNYQSIFKLEFQMNYFSEIEHQKFFVKIRIFRHIILITCSKLVGKFCQNYCDNIR